MLAGEWDPMCKRCYSAEQAGGGSSRKGRNNRFRHHIAGLISGTAPDGTLRTPALRHLDMRLGNYCNLTCRMCTPAASKPWIQAYNRVQPPAYRMDSDGLAAAQRIDWVSDPAVWERFRQQLPGIEWLHFAGGEPMLIPEMLEALQICVDSGFAGQIDLSYNTNATLLPKRVAELWPKFKSVSVSCSIDGYGSLNEYIRRPSRWRDVDRHLRMLDAHFHDWNLREISIHTTVQVYNLLDLDKLYAYLRAGFAHVLPAPLLSPLSWPAYLSVQSLPFQIKALARQRLLEEKMREEYRERTNIAWVLSSIDTVIEFMNGSNGTGPWRDFIAFTTSSEREFGDSFARAAPEMAALLTASGILR
jgi:sulfatase maturation enzyme AslB (radical SAM superfamily)